MDRIIDIDEKNMYCVVEPGVIQAQLQAELLKLGLCCNQNGAGTQCSASPIVAHQGFGCLSQSGSYGERNQLALEWITPEGDMVKIGSIGQIGQWFCGDGPGPSLRGVIRGNVVPLGGLGIFTKAAMKLYHFPGPGEVKLKGRSPLYVPTNMSDNMVIRIYSFPGMDELDAFQQEVGESELAFEVMGFNRGMTAANRACSNPEYLKYYKEYEDELGDYCGMVMLGGYSKGDLDWKVKVLGQIAEETGGKSFSLLEQDRDVAEGYMWRWTRPTSSIREVFRGTGCFAGEVGGTDVWRLMADYIVKTGDVKQKLIDDGLIMDDGHPPFTQMIEHSHGGHGELLIRYYPNEKNWSSISEWFMKQANDIAINGHFGVPGHVFQDAQHDIYGPHVMNYHKWLRKFKKAFDPLNASEGSNHITSQE
jgi:glycolate oxidase